MQSLMGPPAVAREEHQDKSIMAIEPRPLSADASDFRLSQTRFLRPKSTSSTALFCGSSNGDCPGCRDYNEIVKHTFPLSLDHLIPLIQYNIIRASLTNASILSIHLPAGKCGPAWSRVPLFPAPLTIPDSLAPTVLQLSTPHDVWIDLLPDPTMRDNAIRALDTIDVTALQRDLTGSQCGAGNNVDFVGILAWNDPWRPDGWELSEGFVKKWSILLLGCWELLAATNRWRAKRGEEPLVLEM